MAERLTVSLEDGSVDRLRELAGGERKVGAYLSQVIAWLWTNKDALQDTPLEDVTIGVVEVQAEKFAEEIEELGRKLDEQKAHNESVQERLAQLEARLAQASQQELENLAPHMLPVLEKQRKIDEELKAQQDSSQRES